MEGWNDDGNWKGIVSLVYFWNGRQIYVPQERVPVLAVSPFNSSGRSCKDPSVTLRPDVKCSVYDRVVELRKEFRN